MTTEFRAERLILHLGHGKTGSTSIQRCLRSSAPQLMAAGVLFPDPGRHDNHQLLFPHLHGDLPDDPVQMASLADTVQEARANASRLWEDLLTQIAREKPRTIVLSCENQFRPLPTEALARLTENCARIAKRTDVVAYLRSPAPFFLSNVQQDIKKRPEFRPISPSRIRDTLEPFVDHGPGPVHARRFARDHLLGGDVVVDFVSRFLPELDPDALARGSEEDNTSVSAEAMTLLQQVFRGTRELPRRYAEDKKALRKIIVAMDAEVPGAKRPGLFPQVRAICEARVTDLEWTQHALDVSFPDMGAPEMPQPEAEALFSELRDVAQICAVDDTRVEALWQASLSRAKARSRPWSRLFRP
ncbi:hypothetical protein [Mameliella sediminis]|uniref:hypothetical protein n=1 Tax=Mameliella sediminis TaxID=2836866 RepID=UPI001C4844A3|nr:hypothetical protein [Mameliella sediminis]MBV7397400.1 hypothetical protein [Mameliella sediminis]